MMSGEEQTLARQTFKYAVLLVFYIVISYSILHFDIGFVDLISG